LTDIVQEAPTAKLVPPTQAPLPVAVWPKLLFVILTELMVSVALPVLVTVTVWMGLVEPTTWLVKVRLAGDRLAPGVVVPVPLRATVCGLPGALSMMVIAADRLPVVVGLKYTLRAQLAPGGNEAPDPQPVVV
jgi:hypothetical protein